MTDTDKFDPTRAEPMNQNRWTDAARAELERAYTLLNDAVAVFDAHQLRMAAAYADMARELLREDLDRS